MFSAAFAGFLLGASLIIAIGAQNAFILRQGIARRHVFVLCLICALSDALLIALGVGGLGSVINSQPALIAVATWGGAAFLLWYASVALRRALAPQVMEVGVGSEGSAQTLRAAILTCLAFTFLNPHVWLDTVVLLGALSSRWHGADRAAFAGGAMTASFVWFFALGYGARLLAPLFARPAAWRVLDSLIALVMAGLAVMLN